MPTAPVYIDTVALLALSNRDDALRPRAVVIRDDLARAATPLVTTQWVLAEFLGHASRGSLRAAAVAITDRLFASPRTTVVPASQEGWAAAFELYRARPDKEWSLVDCASILTCRERGIQRVFTRDHHFTQAGFDVLLQ